MKMDKELKEELEKIKRAINEIGRRTFINWDEII